MERDRKEKILIYSIIVTVCIIVVFIIIMIWKPMVSKSNNFNTYDSNVNYENTMITYYRNYINENLKITNFDKLYSKLDPDYISSLGISNKDEIKEYLRENKLISMTYEINSVDLYSSDDRSNIFLVTYTVSGKQKYANIIESSPYNFKISFIQDDNLKELLTDVKLRKTLDDVKYDFEITEATKSSISFNLTITNNSNKNIVYDFSNLNSLQLKYGDNSYINMAAIANSSTVNYEISPGSSKSIDVLFNLSFSNQRNIIGARFNNVKIDGNTYTIDI